MNKYLENIKNIIFDLDGTIYFKDKAIEGAKETINKLKEKNFNIRFVTNTDSINRKIIHRNMLSYGIENVSVEDIFTCSSAASSYLEQKEKNSVFLLCSDDVKSEFDKFKKSNTKPEYIIVGEPKESLSYESVNTAFRCIMNGAEILAMQSGTYYYTSKGINLDTGAYVKMLEYASGKKSISVGKPSKDFFNMALSDLNTKANETLVIGDDINSDIKGAKNIGARSILVRTGKYKKEILESSSVKPDFIIDSVYKLLCC